MFSCQDKMTKIPYLSIKICVCVEDHVQASLETAPVRTAVMCFNHYGNYLSHSLISDTKKILALKQKIVFSTCSTSFSMSKNPEPSQDVILSQHCLLLNDNENVFRTHSCLKATVSKTKEEARKNKLYGFLGQKMCHYLRESIIPRQCILLLSWSSYFHFTINKKDQRWKLF